VFNSEIRVSNEFSTSLSIKKYSLSLKLNDIDGFNVFVSIFVIFIFYFLSVDFF
jgi:hypothetical protein